MLNGVLIKEKVKSLNNQERLQLIGVITILIMSFLGVFYKPEISALKGLVVIIGFIGLIAYNRELFSSKPFLFFYAAVFLQLISWLYSLHLAPDWAEQHPKIDRLGRLFICLFMAWIIKDSNKYILGVLASFVAGLIVLPWIDLSLIEEIGNGWNGVRIDLNIRNAQHTALFYGIALLAMLTYSTRFFKVKKNRVFIILLWGISVSFLMSIIVFSQVRAAWLALAICIVIGFLFLAKDIVQSSLNTKVVALLISIGVVSSVIFFSPIMDDRVSSEKEVYQYFIDGNIEDMPYTSIGVRIHSWRAALQFWAESPIFGWGGEARTLVIKETNWLPEHVKNSFGHLHNTYLEILVTYGILGLLWYLIFIGWLCLVVFKLYRRKGISKETMVFYSLCLIFWTVLNFFESYLNFWTGVVVFNMIVSMIVASYWQAKATGMLSNNTEIIGGRL